MGARWSELERFLCSSSGAVFCDDAVCGCLPVYEAEQLLEEFDISATPPALHELGRLVDRLVTSGEA